jgi:HAD superfamily hydrolase (TIGR01509 family)
MSKIDVMRRLHGQGIKVAVVSNCNKANIQLLLYKLELLDEVDLWVSAEDVDNPKPSPEGYIVAMMEFCALPEETLIFEDSPVGLQAAYTSDAHVVEVLRADEITSMFVTTHISLANRVIE